MNEKDKIINNLFANVDYTAEAENYPYYGVTDREEIKEDVRYCMKESLKEYLIFDEPNEEDVETYVNGIMNVIESRD